MVGFREVKFTWYSRARRLSSEAAISTVSRDPVAGTTVRNEQRCADANGTRSSAAEEPSAKRRKQGTAAVCGHCAADSAAVLRCYLY